MHRLRNRNAEVAVISDELIKSAAILNKDSENANAISDENEIIEFTNIKTLALSFANIFKIDNLETLKNLVKLQLDNNAIQELTGLSHLTQLEWLDVSFNNISQIQGLENLVNLTDLSLFNNCITKLENLENLKKLQVLSIGNNAMSNTEQLLYMKCLENLRVLNLSGNPLCSDPEYRSYILAHFEKLQYFDYMLIEANDRIQAREQYQDELEELKEIKAIEIAAKLREQENDKYLCMLEDANIIILETLLKDMFKEDTEIGKIEILPGLRSLIEDYTEKAKHATDDVKIILLEKYTALTSEMEVFHSKYADLISKSQAASIKAIEAYQRNSKSLIKAARNNSKILPNEIDSKEMDSSTDYIQENFQQIEVLHMELLNIEFDLFEVVQELLLSMEKGIEIIGADSRTIAIGHFRTIETLENHFFENLTQLAVTLLERLAAEDSDEDEFLTEECRAILNDRDALYNAINGTHDIHIGKLLAQEDNLREQIIQKITNLATNAKDKEWARNRSRIAEIIAMKEKHISEIYHLQDELRSVEEEIY